MVPRELPASLMLPAFWMAAFVPTLRALSCMESRESVEEGVGGGDSTAYLAVGMQSAWPAHKNVASVSGASRTI